MSNIPKPGGIFLGTMTHDGKLDYIMARAFYAVPTREREVFWTLKQSSLLAEAYNHLWCKALNLRKEHNLKWFAILHADIRPEDFWCDKLIAEAEKYNADVMSAVVPIKEPSGVTSTAIGTSNHYQRAGRLTMKQIWQPETKETFSIDDVAPNLYEQYQLLVNTGCFVCRLDQPWCENVHFTINDRVIKMNGQFLSQVEPEDWFFSRRVAEEGGLVMATRAVKLEHIGGRSYHSDQVWGEMVDPANQ